MTEIELVRLIGAFCGGFMGGLLLILKVVIPRTIGAQIDKQMDEIKANDLRHIKDKIGKLSETVVRLDERMTEARKDIDILFDKLDKHIEGATK